MYQLQKENRYDRSLLMECAETLEDLLVAVESGQVRVRQGKKKKQEGGEVWNKAIEERKRREVAERAADKEREERR